jgi:hypothetical protein
MAACDYGHDAGEVRRLPTSGGAAVNVCRQHYNKEIAMRKRRNAKEGLSGEARFDTPSYSSLEKVE